MSMTDEELEMEMEAAMDDEDFLDYGIKIKQESDLIDELQDDSDEPEEIEYAKPAKPVVPQMSMFQGQQSSTNGLNLQGGSQQREPTYTLDMHLFHKRKDKPPLYLLNPDDYPHDPQKQLQIRRATITYRHHQEKKELIRRLTEENANLKSVMEIYSQREDAMAEFCVCESAKKIIKDFNPKSFLIEPTPPQKLAPLPPIKRLQDYSMNGSEVRTNGVPQTQSWTNNLQGQNVPTTNRMIILRKPSLGNTTPGQISNSVGATQTLTGNQTSQAQVQNIIRLHQERLNRMQSPVQQAKNPLPVVKIEPSTSTDSNNPEVHQILQQMQFAQIRLDLDKKTSEPSRQKEGVNQPQTSGSSQAKPLGTASSQIIRSVPQISSSVIARTGIRIQTPNGIRIIDPSGIRYLSQSAVNQLRPGVPGRFTVLSQSGMKQMPNSTLKIIPRSAVRIVQQRPGVPQTLQGSGLSLSRLKFVPNPMALGTLNKSNPPLKLSQLYASNSTQPSLIVPKKEPIDIVEIMEDEIEINQSINGPPTQQKSTQEIVNKQQESCLSSVTSPLKNDTTNGNSGNALKANLQKQNEETVKLPLSTIEQECPVKIKQEPLDDNSQVHQRRSQRSSALCQPNAKDLLKGIIKKIPRASCGSTIPDDSREELTYARPAKKRKQSMPI